MRNAVLEIEIDAVAVRRWIVDDLNEKAEALIQEVKRGKAIDTGGHSNPTSWTKKTAW